MHHAGDEEVDDCNSKRQCVSPGEHLEKPSDPHLSNHQSESKTPNAIPRSSRDQRRRDSRLLKIQVSQLNQEIERLKNERAADCKELEEQKRIANSLSDQINDRKSLVTKESMVKELQTEVDRERRISEHHRRHYDNLAREGLAYSLRQTRVINSRNRKLEEHNQLLKELRQQHDHEKQAFLYRVDTISSEMARRLDEGIANGQVESCSVVRDLDSLIKELRDTCGTESQSSLASRLLEEFDP